MISGILSEILGDILFIGFFLGFLIGCIHIIIWGIQGYLEEEDKFCLFMIITGCIGIMITVIIVLKAFGL